MNRRLMSSVLMDKSLSLSLVFRCELVLRHRLHCLKGQPTYLKKEPAIYSKDIQYWFSQSPPKRTMDIYTNKCKLRNREYPHFPCTFSYKVQANTDARSFQNIIMVPFITEGTYGGQMTNGVLTQVLGPTHPANDSSTSRAIY